MSNAARNFCYSGVQDMSLHVQKKQFAGEVSSTPGAVIGGWICLKDCRCKSIHRLVGVEDARYLSIYMRRKARRNLLFHPPKLGDPPRTRELVCPLHHPLLLWSTSMLLRSCGQWIAALFYYCSSMEGVDGSSPPLELGN